MACNNLITEGILFDCADIPKKGIENSRAVLINMADIDRTATTVSGATVSALTLKAGATGYAVEWYKDLASATGTFTPSTESIDGFSHSFLTRLATSSTANAERAHELKNGKFVLVYETNYKGADNAEAYKIAALESGMRLSELTMDTNTSSGSILFTLATQEGETEQYPYHILSNTDYATTTADFDSLFVQP